MSCASAQCDRFLSCLRLGALDGDGLLTPSQTSARMVTQASRGIVRPRDVAVSVVAAR